jgi:hypothetical protein
MRIKKFLISFAGIVSFCVLAAGCIQMPTEKRGISDLRPSLTFRADAPELRDAQVFVDGLDMGRVGSYLEGESVLRILPGTHILRVLSGHEVLIDEKIYLGDGVTRVFIVNRTRS